MKPQFTLGHVRMLVCRAERELAQIIDASAKDQPARKNVDKLRHFALHQTVVSLTRLFREHVPSATGIATLIAREYAKGVDAESGSPTLACVRTISSIVQQAREQYLSANQESGTA